MRTDLFDYELPEELIAQTPLPRGESRLLVLNKTTGEIAHRRFPDLLDYLRRGDALVLNDTRVSARRVIAVRPDGREDEALLTRPVGERCWEALFPRARSLRPGSTLILTDGPQSAEVTVVSVTDEGARVLEFVDSGARDRLAFWGTAPLPPYIRTPLAREDEGRYQTVYAAHDGSAAAPTAGLHFTPELLAGAEQQGVRTARLTLHVGVGTFRPVRTEDIEAHEMHAESAHLSEETARIVNDTPGRVVAVGTTSVRTLESAAKNAVPPARVAPFAGETRLFITPGYSFQAVDALITNFHLPRSTLLMLVSALAGRDNILRAYNEAVRERYRFFSFGDAMLIL